MVLFIRILHIALILYFFFSILNRRKTYIYSTILWFIAVLLLLRSQYIYILPVPIIILINITMQVFFVAVTFTDEFHIKILMTSLSFILAILTELIVSVIAYPFLTDVYEQDENDMVPYLLLSLLIAMFFYFSAIFFLKHKITKLRLKWAYSVMVFPISQIIIMAAMANAFYVTVDRSFSGVLVAGVVLSIFADAFLLITLQKIIKRSEDEKRLMLLQSEQKNSYAHFLEMQAVYEQDRKFKHEINNHLSALKGLYMQHNHEEFEKMLSQISEINVFF